MSQVATVRGPVDSADLWIDPNVLPFLPQWHYLHIHDEVLPYAREHGATEEQIVTC
jgi:predicted metal-dependent phosphotriesterase family hydrolase